MMECFSVAHLFMVEIHDALINGGLSNGAKQLRSRVVSARQQSKRTQTSDLAETHAGSGVHVIRIASSRPLEVT